MDGEPGSERDALIAVRRARHRTTQLSLGLLVVSLTVVLVRFPHTGGLGGGLRLPWWVLALGFALAELTTFDLEINRESHTFTFSEVPTVLGLLFAGPEALLLGRLIGEGLVLVLRDRQILPKLIFNLSMFAAETVVAVVVFHAMTQGDVTSAWTWLAALAAVLVAGGVSITCVTLAMRWHGADPQPRRLLAVGTMTAVTNCAVAIVGSLLMRENPAAIVLFAVLAATAVVSFRIYAALYRRHANLEMLYAFTTVVSRSRSAGEVLEAMLDHARELMRAEIAEIDLEDPEDDRKAIRVTSGEATVVATPGTAAAIAIVRSLLSDREPALVIGRDDPDPDRRAIAEQLGLKDLVAARVTELGRLVGVVIVGNRRGEVSSFDGEDGALFETLAQHASIALANGHLLDRLSDEVKEREHQALHDALTGLPNRVLLYRRLKVLLDTRTTERTPFAVMLLDLDGFKEVNDTLGHDNGDLLLQDMARRLERARPTDVTVARLGGDEFAILAPNVGSRTEALALTERLVRALEQPCLLDGLSVELGASVGVAIWPKDAHDASSLLKLADVAMYRAKNSRAGVAMYESSADSSDPRRSTILRELREAITQHELTIHYQPQVTTADGTPVGLEALVRWQHPTLGLVQPDEFVPVAEQGGLIAGLTFAVIDQALADLVTLDAGGIELGVSVNISERALHDPRLAPEIERMTALHGVNPARLTLELREATVMAEPPRTIPVLERLRTAGVRLAIDDFGTGYSSLSHLSRLPLDALKVDRRFVTTMGVDSADARLVRSMVHLGRDLHLTVVAEGVEDDLAMERLRRMGCPVMQGYCIARPMPLPELATWLVGRVRAQATGGPARSR